jgi:hypothetical protein
LFGPLLPFAIMGPGAGYNRRKSEFVIREKSIQSPATEVPDSATVLAQLDRVLATHLFQHSKDTLPFCGTSSSKRFAVRVMI